MYPCFRIHNGKKMALNNGIEDFWYTKSSPNFVFFMNNKNLKGNEI